MAIELTAMFEMLVTFLFFVYFFSMGYNAEYHFSGGFFMLIGAFSFLALIYQIISNNMYIYTILSPLLILFFIYMSYISLHKMFWEDETKEKNE